MEKAISLEGYTVGFHQEPLPHPPQRSTQSYKPILLEESNLFAPFMQMAKDFTQKQTTLSRKVEAIEKDLAQAACSLLSPPQTNKQLSKKEDPPKALPPPQAPMEEVPPEDIQWCIPCDEPHSEKVCPILS